VVGHKDGEAGIGDGVGSVADGQGSVASAEASGLAGAKLGRGAVTAPGSVGVTAALALQQASSSGSATPAATAAPIRRPREVEREIVLMSSP
jgi:hypothetical protein